MLVVAKEKVRIIEEERTKKLRGNEHEQTGDGDTSAQVQKRAPTSTPTRTRQLLPAVAATASHDQTRTQFPSATATTATASIASALTAHLHQEEPLVETAAVNKDVNLNSSYHARASAALQVLLVLKLLISIDQ